MTDTISAAFLWLKAWQIDIPADVQIKARYAGIYDAHKSRLDREEELQSAIARIFAAHKAEIIALVGRQFISLDALAAFRSALIVELRLAYIDAGMDRLDEIAEIFGIPADSPAALGAIDEWAKVEASRVADAITQTTLDRIDSLRKMQTGIGYELSREEIERALQWVTGDSRTDTIAVSEVSSARWFTINVYKGQLDKLGIPNQIRWLTEEDDRVCKICGPLDHKVERDWHLYVTPEILAKIKAGQLPHPKCRCDKVLERPRNLEIPKG